MGRGRDMKEGRWKREEGRRGGDGEGEKGEERKDGQYLGKSAAWRSTHKHGYMAVWDGPADWGLSMSMTSGRVCTKAKQREDEMLLLIRAGGKTWFGRNFGSGGCHNLRRKDGPSEAEPIV